MTPATAFASQASSAAQKGHPMTLSIDPEFKKLIPPLSADEYAQLEANLKAEGCRDALVAWRHGDELTLIDGHNRHEICTKHNLPFSVVEREFEDRNDVLVWMVTNQLARRNLNIMSRGELALRMKEAIAAKAKQQQLRKPADFVPQNSAEQTPIETRIEVAKIAEVSHDTIRKVEAISANAPEQIKQKARSGELSVDRAFRLTTAIDAASPEVAAAVLKHEIENPKVVQAWVTAEKQNPRFAKESLERGFVTNLDGEDVPIEEADETLVRVMATEDEYERVKRQETHIQASIEKKRGTPAALQMSESNEWYTPADYVNAARLLMGEIDLDPASNEYANRTVQAKRFFTINDDGLKQTWSGRVWLNPPYGRDNGESNQGLWSARLLEAYKHGSITEAVMLVNAVTDRSWFHPLWDHQICFVRQRIRFYNTETEAGSPTHGSVLVYLGKQTDRFAEIFGKFGRIVVPDGAISRVLAVAA